MKDERSVKYELREALKYIKRLNQRRGLRAQARKRPSSLSLFLYLCLSQRRQKIVYPLLVGNAVNAYILETEILKI